MVLAEFGSGQVLLSILWVFLFVIWFWLLITIFSDLFRDHELSGWAKAGWVILVIILPFLGILIYLIARGKGMTERSLQAQQQSQEQFDDYVRSASGGDGGGSADQIAKLAELRDKGALTDEEFEKQKAKILA